MDVLSSVVTGRTSDLFSSDTQSHLLELRERIGGSRVLVIGGGGSIGTATVRALTTFQPHCLHVVDQSENNLAELVRDLRSDKEALTVQDFRTLPLDYGSAVMRRFLGEVGQYDFILNFAALKHVRSEKDIYSLLQMLDTNIVKAARLLRWLSELGFTGHYFSVSTDKAANPVNLMGASKRVMEHLIFSDEITPPKAHVTSARFANVAFSDGSLLKSFLERLQKGQPIAVPRHTRRYFISLREAGQICLLAAICAPDRYILIPRLDGATDLRDLESVAISVLRYYGLEPRIYENEAEAKAALQFDLDRGSYPLLSTPLDTSGEKPYEEFFDDCEIPIEVGMSHVLAIKYLSAAPGAISDLVRHLELIIMA